MAFDQILLFVLNWHLSCLKSIGKSYMYMMMDTHLPVLLLYDTHLLIDDVYFTCT